MNSDKEVDVNVDINDPEYQFILRVPEAVAVKLKKMLRTTKSELEKQVSITLEEDLNSGTLCVDKWVLHGKIVDLPTIVESLKSADRNHFYKTADICKMMICKQQENDPEGLDGCKEKSESKAKDSLWPHGLTPPMKNARRKKFRKTLRRPHSVDADVMDEVNRLLRFDSDAVSTRYEVVIEEGSSTSQDKSITSEESLIEAFSNSKEAEHHIFGESLSDSDEDEHAAVEEGAAKRGTRRCQEKEPVKSRHQKEPKPINGDSAMKKNFNLKAKRRSNLKD